MSVETGSNITPLFGDSAADDPPPARPRIKKLRLLAIAIPLALLAVASTAFGMMMAVASDLPDLENRKEYQDARNSVLTDVRKNPLGILTNNQSRQLVSDSEISTYMRSAIIAIEDRRFYENSGVDLRGIGRALVQDVVKGGAAQGGSTIAQQFVKNALQAQSDRTIFQKMREAALAYHLTRKWTKSKILTQYLNSIYFGNGAYGIESAARVYFGAEHPGCGTRAKPCASELAPQEAALLAGMVANPTAYDPVAHPATAKGRRNLVLRNMLDQDRISRLEYFNAVRESLPANVEPPTVRTKAPYFTTWVRQRLVDEYGPRRALEGGLQVRTTIDLDLQDAAEKAITRFLPNLDGPSAALVAIDNDSGEVRAMVGGRDYQQQPFNLATQGQRQPGSAFKPFILAEALQQGIGPGSVWPSRKRVFNVPGSTEKFVVNNFESKYTGSQTLAGGLTFSDNAVYSTVGIKVGTRKIARLARRMGVRTPVSSNYAMTLGGLREGVTPLDLAHAYETIIEGGRRIQGSLGGGSGPVGIRSVSSTSGTLLGTNVVKRVPVLSRAVADTELGIMGTVITQGTGTRASIGDGEYAGGKTGTTENSGDAWFVGFTKRWTVAVWVGYPDRLRPMLTEFNGAPVEGGTFPALIWHDFMVTANAVVDDRIAKDRLRKGGAPEQTSASGTTTPASPAPGDDGASAAGDASPSTGTSGDATDTGGQTPATQQPGATPSAPDAAATPDSGTAAGGTAAGGTSAPPAP